MREKVLEVFGWMNIVDGNGEWKRRVWKIVGNGNYIEFHESTNGSMNYLVNGNLLYISVNGFSN